MNKCLFAHTDPGASYPPYINASVDPGSGDVVVCVRSPSCEGREGPTAAITLDRDDAVALARRILAEYAP